MASRALRWRRNWTLYPAPGWDFDYDEIKYAGDDNIMVIVIFFQVIPPDFPSTGSDMQPSGDEASGCTCGDEGQVQ